MGLILRLDTQIERDNEKNNADDQSLFGFKRILKGSASKDWKKLSKKVNVHPVDGNHFNMLDKNHNEKLHLYLHQYLSES